MQAHMAPATLRSAPLALFCVCVLLVVEAAMPSGRAGLVCVDGTPCSFVKDLDVVSRDPSAIDTSIHPDDWSWKEATSEGLGFGANLRLVTSGAEPPEQLVKVTDRRHRHPVFATMCSIFFLATVITLLIFCIS